ncbi:MAG: FAD-dependent oxidoreductase [Actinobacteria bacterium]|nr:FAD-dependent oxidoreductase [Actinomycetota bacterium]
MSVARGLEYYDENIPCLAACPVHTNAGMYVAAIADGDDERAYLTARMPNPFASVCGRVCAAPCEDACRRGEIDRPIAIRALKRYLTEQFGPEARTGRWWEAVAAPPTEERPESVGIVGGGPAGMACAHDLRRLGYQVTVYEATDRLGGAMWLGIPEYRLDRQVLARDIEAIVDLGVEVRYETRLGTDVTLAELRRRHDALFLGIGATLGRGLDIEGADADGVFKAIEFLINMNRGFEVAVGERVLVVGGGDVAMDAARTALRAADYQAKRDGGEADAIDAADVAVAERSSMTEALDAARTAMRAGAREITVISLESREEMPAHEFEVEEAKEEGITFVHRRGPGRILVEDGRVTGLETTGVTRVFDDDGRFAPQFDPTDLRATRVPSWSASPSPPTPTRTSPSPARSSPSTPRRFARWTTTSSSSWAPTPTCATRTSTGWSGDRCRPCPGRPRSGSSAGRRCSASASATSTPSPPRWRASPNARARRSPCTTSAGAPTWPGRRWACCAASWRSAAHRTCSCSSTGSTTSAPCAATWRRRSRRWRAPTP